MKEQFLYLEATLGLAISKIVILFFPFRFIAKLLGKHMKESPFNDVGNIEEIRLISKSIHTMSCHLPWECKCLVQAITAKKMLDRRQTENTLYLGLKKENKNHLEAHAWVRTGQQIVTGDHQLQYYTVVSTFF